MTKQGKQRQLIVNHGGYMKVKRTQGHTHTQKQQQQKQQPITEIKQIAVHMTQQHKLGPGFQHPANRIGHLRTTTTQTNQTNKQRNPGRLTRGKTFNRE